MSKIFFLLYILALPALAQDTIFFRNIVVVNYEEKQLSGDIIENWQHKDIFIDTIPGISTKKLYDRFLSKEGDTIVVAVIDGGVDIYHEDLKNQIWVNPGEINGNGKDDDRNGYVDDIHGWNFLGARDGTNLHYARLEFIRILVNKGYLGKQGLQIPETEKDPIILEAARSYNQSIQVLKEDKEYISETEEEFQFIKSQLKSYFPDNKFDIATLNKIDTTRNKELKKAVNLIKSFIKYDLTEEWLAEFKQGVQIVENYKLNPEFDDRKIIGDVASDFKDIKYGNNDIVGDTSIDTHGTMVAGLIAASRDNDIGIKGIADKVKLMILRAVPKGDEYDKDVAFAIRYAVDNGAQIINMSFGKSFSPHKKEVLKAIKYAADKNVLLVHASGNNNIDIDKKDFFPLDYENGIEVSNNFINVGATHYKLNFKLSTYFSDYGSKNVDVFAPGNHLYTTYPGNKYVSESGTSLAAPLVTGIAALIRSRFPNLTASQIKSIILSSGDAYNLEVTIPGQSKKDPRVPFSSLSKSGKIVNAYNALLMAEQLSNDKK